MAVPKTIRKGTSGKHKIRLAQDSNGQVFGIADGKIVATGTIPDLVWNDLISKAGQANPDYFGFEGAIKVFQSHFPNGFQAQKYLEQERDYKLRAKTKLDDTLPLDQIDTCLNPGQTAASVFSKTNLLAANEMIKLGPALKSKDGDAIVRAIASFTREPNQKILSELEKLLKPHECAKWTVITYLPYLWRPHDHMYLKPTVTRDYASRVGHYYHDVYEPSLKIKVYKALQDLTIKTTEKVKNLNPRDNIDIQSFIWVVGAYTTSATK